MRASRICSRWAWVNNWQPEGPRRWATESSFFVEAHGVGVGADGLHEIGGAKVAWHGLTPMARGYVIVA
jgi:hypothetical protein